VTGAAAASAHKPAAQPQAGEQEFMSSEQSTGKAIAAAEPLRAEPRAVARPWAQPGGGFWLPALSLCWRELVRFYRQRSRVIGVIGSPLVFWLLIGSGFGGSFRAEGAAQGYLEYFFPGTIVLTVLFTSIFCMMSVIEDRREGFLLSVLVAPIPRASLVLGKVLGGATLAMLQALLLALCAPLLGITPTLGAALLVIAALFLTAFALTSLGFLIAWRLDSTHGFHALINLFLIPMWMLSGALFPVSGAQTWVAWVMRLNPLTYSVAAVREALYLGHPAVGANLALSFAVTIAFASVAFLAALVIANRRER
jgi:ABC-2 type transport system permease protein